MDNVDEFREKIDSMYKRASSGDISVIDDLNRLIEVEKDTNSSLISLFQEKISAIFDIVSRYKDNLLNIENLRSEFNILKMMRFNIVNNYVMGLVKASDIEDFRDSYNKFYNILYAYKYKEEEMMEIAKMKSMIQHFRMEILEDMDVLDAAYQNNA